ncbi:SDR family oxidoreductase [Euzebya sp.]|uniref:SDR family oxidoreductase n=1 Tax=Euzebya sp. TaxID=1971409 RepID=UPI003516994E
MCGRDAGKVEAARAEGLDAAAVDVTDHGAARAWLDDVAARHGALHVLVANAGGPPQGMATAFDVQAYRDAVELSLLSLINLAQAGLPHLRDAGWGRILFVTSKSVRQPIPALALSNTARMGVVGYARSLVADLAAQDAEAGRQGTVTVNVLAPGSTRTGRLESLAAGPDGSGDVEEGLAGMAAGIPLGRVGRPEEFAAVATFLAGEPAAFVTGQVVLVDGGEVQAL